MSLILLKEVIKTTKLKVTRQLWLNMAMAVLISMPIISVMGSSAIAGFEPPPPDPNRTTGRTSSSSR